MGVDTILEFRYNPEKQDLQDLNYRFREANPGVVYDYGEGDVQSAFTNGREWQGVGKDKPYVLSVRTLFRWYGPGYERGPWPQLSAAIRWLLYNTEEVWYWNDYAENRPNPITFEQLEEFDKHWANVGGLPYRGYMTEGREKGPLCCGFPTEPWIWGGGNVGFYCPACHKKNGYRADNPTI